MRFPAVASVGGALALLLCGVGSAHADATRCKAAILRSSAKFVQAKATALANCKRNVVAGKLPPSTDCHAEPRANNLIAKAAARLQATIAGSCGGADKVCGTPDGDDSPGSLGWGAVCPNFENGACTNAIVHCGDIADCLLCIDEAAVDQAAALYYDAFTPSAPSSDLNRCQREIGRSATAFLRSTSQALATCWSSVNLGRGTAPCPVPGDGRAAAAIARAEARKQRNICHACGGNDESCDGLGDFSPAAIGFASSCPAVTMPGGGSCAGTVNTLQDLVDCVDCVAEFKVDCTDRAAVPWNGQGYPAECNPGAAPTATPAITPTRTATPAVTATRTATPAVTATRTATPTVTATSATTPTPSVTATGVPTTTRTVTPTATVTRTPTPTVTSTVVAATATRTATPVPTATRTATPIPTATATPAACGNGVIDAGEDCDPAGGAATSCQTVSNTSASITCNPTTCQCACPTRVQFTGDASSPISLLDTGWTGISHRAPIISNGTTTVTLSGCTGSSRPCGVCNVSGPVENTNAGAGNLATRRCVNDTSTKCTSDANCGGGVGSCQYFFGAPLPLAAGGVTTCVVNQFSGPVSGTANVETGDAVTNAHLTSRVYNGLAIDNPCPRCTDTGGFNDGVNGGTCDGGARVGLACDANGDVPVRADFGRTSLDCPPTAAALIATLAIDLSNKTALVVRTVTTSSPNCTGSAGDKCLCSTCNNGNADPCFTNADCPDPDGAGPFTGVCGGTRCLSGSNAGAPCSTATQCPGGSCTRPGEPIKPSACVDDTTVANRVMECADGDGDGEGDCTIGPTDQNCTVASGHGQRGCTTDADCGGAAGSCASIPRHCFLTGGGTFQPSGHNDGSDSLIAVGMADAPMQDVSNPTLAAVFCVGPTGAPSINNVAGLPGPGRITIRGTALGLP